ncbi:unnamed protein product [Cladocopium goreaui]|uniref:Uncharacterized protein n=1 Tax=Cladocopium goreaui TaxID=2562237 RepID=A0A9P1DA45_9DINO|nr:unnamed protein product [Cladocopium goreaui]
MFAEFALPPARFCASNCDVPRKCQVCTDCRPFPTLGAIMKLIQVVLGVFATSVYLQGCGEDKVYTSVDEALAAICSSTVCTEYCNTCVTCTMTGNRSATHSHMETCGMNPRGGETCKEVLPCGGS